ncbi:NAD(P)-binding domain-containing protein [uncultured Cohaesibacter sp.]|uniref:NADPH-dependent F420 reductase n=1 Tax=uncultured Cohaesibacter sp. TaxID=1002546 RepID=UPI00292E2F2A|nr:NAD(P)-binding domain-containing protein [uncultured Cohaesibacter sp.]
MQVAILGAGSMGSGLASLIATAGHEVTIGVRDIAKAVSATEAVGSSANGGGIAAASQSADIIILALPYGAVPAVLKAAGDLTGKVVIDITNPITEDFKGLTVGHTSSAAEEIQKLIPSASVARPSTPSLPLCCLQRRVPMRPCRSSSRPMRMAQNRPSPSWRAPSVSNRLMPVRFPMPAFLSLLAK